MIVLEKVDFIAGVVCGVSGLSLLLILISKFLRFQEILNNRKTLELISNLEKSATIKEYKLGRETEDTNESDS